MLKVFVLAMALLATSAVATPKPPDFSADRRNIEAIFAAHDKLAPAIEEYMKSVADDIILMPNGGRMIEGKAAYRAHVKEFYESGSIQIRHEVIEVHSFPEVVIARGRAVGSFTPHGGGAVSAFETRNLFVFRRIADGSLQIWQIIFNDAGRNQ